MRFSCGRSDRKYSTYCSAAALRSLTQLRRRPVARPFTFMLTARGIPLIYYGDEVALPGGNDPDNRRNFPGRWPNDARNAFAASGRSASEQSVWAHVQKLLKLRAERQRLA